MHLKRLLRLRAEERQKVCAVSLAVDLFGEGRVPTVQCYCNAVMPSCSVPTTISSTVVLATYRLLGYSIMSRFFRCLCP